MIEATSIQRINKNNLTESNWQLVMRSLDIYSEILMDELEARQEGLLAAESEATINLLKETEKLKHKLEHQKIHDTISTHLWAKSELDLLSRSLAGMLQDLKNIRAEIIWGYVHSFGLEEADELIADTKKLQETFEKLQTKSI